MTLPLHETALTPASANALRTAVSKVQAYVHSRRTWQGGFSSYRTDAVQEPSITETFHAMAVLHLTACPALDTVKPQVQQYLAAITPPHADLRALACYTSLHTQLLAVPVHTALRAQISARPAPALDASSPSRLSSALHQLSLLTAVRHCAGLAPRPLTQEWLAIGTDQAFPAHVFDLACWLQIVDDQVRRAMATTFAAYLTAIQHPATGFCPHPNAVSSNLEIISAGMTCCALLGLDVQYPLRLVDYVLDCQLANGSFARAPGASATLESTHHAMHILALLLNGADPMPGNAKMALDLPMP